MKIEKNSRVKLAYTLRYDDASGDIIETVSAENPLPVLLGNEELLEKFEEKIIGLKVGDTFEFTLTPEEGYGDFDEEGIVRVPKAELFDGIEEDIQISEGEEIPIIMDGSDEETSAIVLEIENDIVTLDFNHVLAGETLYFSGEIVEIIK